jgi:hypothetical protein
MHDKSRVKGWIEVIITDRHGNIKYHIGSTRVRQPSNIITNVGLAALVRLMGSGLTESKFGYIAIGTGTTPESETDTALENEIKRKAATIRQVTTTIDGDTCFFEAIFSRIDGLTGSHNISEIGIFNAPTGGILLARRTFLPAPVNWDTEEQVTARYWIQFTR